MTDLLTQVLDAHGGMDRWRSFSTLTAHLAAGGPFWGLKGWPDLLTDVTLELDTQREHITITPFPAPGQSCVLDVGPERFTIKYADGTVLDRRDEPRTSFGATQTATTPWDAIQTGYFISYAMWNYLTAPFLFTCPAVEAHEIEPWHEDGQTWRRLAVRFSDSIATHNRDQVFYYDTDGLERRMDYAPVVTGNPPIAHYTDEERTFDGIVIPTRRRVYRRNPDGTADRNLAFITLDIDAVKLS